jgi:hypothetical protein
MVGTPRRARAIRPSRADWGPRGGRAQLPKDPPPFLRLGKMAGNVGQIRLFAQHRQELDRFGALAGGI